MLEGWYCRSIANEAAAAEEEERMVEESKFKKEYKYLKRKFQNLVYVSKPNWICSLITDIKFSGKWSLSAGSTNSSKEASCH